MRCPQYRHLESCVLVQKWRFIPKTGCTSSTVELFFSYGEYLFVSTREAGSTKVRKYSAQSDRELETRSLHLKAQIELGIHLWVHLVDGRHTVSRAQQSLATEDFVLGTRLSTNEIVCRRKQSVFTMLSLLVAYRTLAHSHTSNPKNHIIINIKS